MTEPTVAVIPIRSLRGGKSRLGPAVAVLAREALVGALLLRTVRVVLEAGVADRLVVVSPDPAALHLATCFDPHVEGARQDAAAVGLNGAVEQAKRLAMDAGAREMQIVFGDLPLLAAADLQALAATPFDVTVATDRHGTGTNALRLRLGASGAEFRFAFGPGSAHNHVAEAERLGLEVGLVTLDGTGFDVDVPDDFRTLRERDPRLFDELVGTGEFATVASGGPR